MFNFDTNTVNANVMALANALKVAGAKSATMCYSGSGDNGDVTEMTVAWPEDHALLVTSANEALGDVTYYQVSATFTGTGFETSKSECTANFTTAMTDVCMQTLKAAGHLGWEINEGSSGSMTVFASGYAELSHVDNITESEQTDTEFSQDDEYRDSINRIVDYLKKSGAVNMTAAYYGSYGERMVDTVRVTWPDDIAEMATPLAQAGATAEVNPHTPAVKSQTTTLIESVIDNFIWDLIDYAGHEDFHSENGGDGVLTITSTGHAKLMHQDFSDGEAEPVITYFGENMPDEQEDAQGD